MGEYGFPNIQADFLEEMLYTNLTDALDEHNFILQILDTILFFNNLKDFTQNQEMATD